MLTLTLETSTPRGSLALFEEESLLATETFQALRGHNSKIYGPLKAMLERLKSRRLDRLVVGTGPGSYTGVRIAISIADALALSHEAALIGCSSMVAAEVGAEHERYWVVGDARRGCWYRCECHQGALVGGIVTEDRAPWERAVRDALAAGTPVFTFDLTSPLEGIAIGYPTAERLAQVSVGLSSTGEPVEPSYLAPPHITTARKLGKTLPTSQYRTR